MSQTRAITPMATGIPPALRGMGWMVVMCLAGTGVFACVRMATQSVTGFEAAFFRTLFAVPLVLAWCASTGHRFLSVGDIRPHLARGVFMGVCMLCFFTALAEIPLADATAIGFTVPLIATAGAALLLGERVGWRRWSAVAIGFVGMIVIVRPGLEGFRPAAMLAVVGSVFAAADWMILKRLSRNLPTPVVVAWVTVLMVPVTFLPALTVWQTPDTTTLAWTAGAAVCATVAQASATRAFAWADVSLVAPTSFLQLVFTALLGALAFNEVIDPWTVVGAAIIIGSAGFVARREAGLRAAAR